MNKTVILAGMTGCLSAFLLAGCGTLVFPQARTADPATKPGPVSSEALVESLAQYSMAIREGITGSEDEKIDRFRAAIAADPDNPMLQIELALAFLQAGRYNDMDDQLGAILVKNPAQVRALRLQSFGYRLRGRLREALPPLEKAITLEPAYIGHYIEAASIHNRLGHDEAAAKILEQSLGAVSNRLEAFQALSQLYVEQAAKLRKADQTLPVTPLELIGRGVEEFPTNAVLLSYYADLLTLHEDLETVIEIFARIESLNPADSTIRQKLTLGLLALGDTARSIELLTAIAEKQPDNYRIALYLAELHQQQEDVTKAASYYRRAIELQPALTETYLKLAHLFMIDQRSNEAIYTLEEGRRVNDEDNRLLEMQAYILFRDRQYDQAAPLFSEAENNLTRTRSRPFLANFHATAAISYQMTGHIDEAARFLRRGLSINPRVFNDYVGFAMRGRKNSTRFRTSLEVLEQIITDIPSNIPNHTLLGLLYLRAEEYQPGYTQLHKALALALETEDDESVGAQFYFWLGSAAERIKEFDEAEEHFMKAISLQPDFADAHNYVAYMNAERDLKLEEAYDHVGVALAIEPDNAAYIDTRGWIYYKQGKFEEALVDIQRATELLPNDATITDHLGDIHLALGNEEEALVWWKKSYAIDQTNEEVKNKLTTRGVDTETIETIPPPDPDADDQEEDNQGEQAGEVIDDEDSLLEEIE